MKLFVSLWKWFIHQLYLLVHLAARVAFGYGWRFIVVERWASSEGALAYYRVYPLGFPAVREQRIVKDTAILELLGMLLQENMPHYREEYFVLPDISRRFPVRKFK